MSIQVFLNGFYGMFITMDIEWILQPGGWAVTSPHRVGYINLG